MSNKVVIKKLKTNRNEITVDASSIFATASSTALNEAQSKLRTTLQALTEAIKANVSAIQVTSIALVEVVHSGAGQNGLKVVPAKSELNEVLKIQIEAIAINDDGTKNEAVTKSLVSSGATICEQAWCILAGHFRIAYRPRLSNYHFKGQDKANFKPNPKIHIKGVFRASNVPFPKFKDNGNIRTNSPDDIVPVTTADTKNTFGRYMQQRPINNDQTGFDTVERNAKIESVSSAKEFKTAIIGIMSFWKNQGFKDGEVLTALWDNEELESLIRSDIFDLAIEFSDLVIKTKTRADAMQGEEIHKIEQLLLSKKVA